MDANNHLGNAQGIHKGRHIRRIQDPQGSQRNAERVVSFSYLSKSKPLHGLWLLRRALHNNEEHFPNPRAFDPSRYASDFQSAHEAARNADFALRDHYTFGAGRRQCQGMHIAERSLFLAIARLLWAFDFSMQKDEHGNEIVPDADALTGGVLVRPDEFPVVITPRKVEKAEAVRAEWKKVEGKLNEQGQWKRVPEGMFSKEYVPLVN